jgi:hypothetical protein
MKINEDQRTALEPPDRLRLAVEAGVHPDSLRRFLRGKPVRTLTRRRIEGAAKKLGLALSEHTAPERSFPGEQPNGDQ